jgi:hypothetical protein
MKAHVAIGLLVTPSLNLFVRRRLMTFTLSNSLWIENTANNACALSEAFCANSPSFSRDELVKRIYNTGFAVYAVGFCTALTYLKAFSKLEKCSARPDNP